MSNAYHNAKLREINDRFKALTRGMYKNAKGTELYKAQTDLAWCIHEIQKGPSFTAPVELAKMEKIVSDFEQYVKNNGKT